MVEERLETIVYMCNSDNKYQYKSIVINDGFKVIQIVFSTKNSINKEYIFLGS